MPTIPKYQSSVQSAQAPTVRVSENAPLEAFGGGEAQQRSVAATNKLIQVGQALATKEKEKADDTASMDAYSRLVNKKNDLIFNPQSGAMTKKGKDALGTVDEYGSEFNKFADDIENGLANDDQKVMFQKMRARVGSDLNTTLEKHTFAESQKYQRETFLSASDAARNDAILNYSDPKKVSESLSLQHSLIVQNGQQQGLPPEEISQQIKEAQTKTHTAIIERMLTNGDTRGAKAYFDKNKEGILGDHIPALEKQIDHSATIDQSADIWNKVKGFKLSDGNPDLAKMQSYIDSQGSLSAEKRTTIFNYVKTQAGLATAEKKSREEANNREFMDNIIQMRKSGQSLQDALRVVPKFSQDAYDQVKKEQAVQKVYSGPTQSNPGTYLDLWHGIQDGSTNQEKIDEAYHSGKISTSDYRNLSKESYDSTVKGTTPQGKLIKKRIDSLAAENYPDKEERDAFLYDIWSDAQGKSPQEVWNLANERLKDDPGTGFFSDDPKWKADLQKKDAQNLAWGKVYGDIGQQEAIAIGQGAMFSNGSQQKQWGLPDIDAFATQLGGYDQIKKGTPANAAIQSLVNHGQLVTPANVKSVLSKYPDGKF